MYTWTCNLFRRFGDNGYFMICKIEASPLGISGPTHPPAHHSTLAVRSSRALTSSPISILGYYVMEGGGGEGTRAQSHDSKKQEGPEAYG